LSADAYSPSSQRSAPRHELHVDNEDDTLYNDGPELEDDTPPTPTQSEGVPMVMRDIMTARVVTVDMDDRLEVVKEIFDTMGFHHLLVTDEHKKLSGVVSDRDLLRALSPYVGSAAETARDLATLNKRVHQIMTRHPITLRPEATVAEAVQLLLAHRISCIPIVDDEFRPAGIVSWRDLLKSLGAAESPAAG
jgi:acetoin utilization protein AcuB